MFGCLRLAFAALVLLALLPSSSFAQTFFAHAGIAREAERLEASLAALSPRRPAAELMNAGRAALTTQNDPRSATRAFKAAAARDGQNAEAWLLLARSLLDTTPDPNRPAERYELPAQASAAAYLAYQRSTDNTLKARALSILGEALERRSFWRPAIEALKTSLALVEDTSVRERYERLRSEYGFRILDYTVEQDSSVPRACVQFSEPLARGQDLTQFVAVDGKDAQALVIENQQLCIEGLSHGKNYNLLIRAGLPSTVGETLEKPAELAVYVRDRTPSVRFVGRSYVLPSRGQSGIPVVSVNTEKIAIEIFRIGDRSLAQTINSGDLQRQLWP